MPTKTGNLEKGIDEETTRMRANIRSLVAGCDIPVSEKDFCIAEIALLYSELEKLYSDSYDVWLKAANPLKPLGAIFHREKKMMCAFDSSFLFALPEDYLEKINEKIKQPIHPGHPDDHYEKGGRFAL